MKRDSVKITEAEIRKALRQFQLAGGKITHIPDQVTPRLNAARSRNDSLAGLVELAIPVPADATVTAPE